jgi:hypothetical protein
MKSLGQILKLRTIVSFAAVSLLSGCEGCTDRGPITSVPTAAPVVITTPRPEISFAYREVSLGADEGVANQGSLKIRNADGTEIQIMNSECLSYQLSKNFVVCETMAGLKVYNSHKEEVFTEENPVSKYVATDSYFAYTLKDQKKGAPEQLMIRSEAGEHALSGISVNAFEISNDLLAFKSAEGIFFVKNLSNQSTVYNSLSKSVRHFAVHGKSFALRDGKKMKIGTPDGNAYDLSEKIVTDVQLSGSFLAYQTQKSIVGSFKKTYLVDSQTGTLIRPEHKSSDKKEFHSILRNSFGTSYTLGKHLQVSNQAYSIDTSKELSVETAEINLTNGQVLALPAKVEASKNTFTYKLSGNGIAYLESTTGTLIVQDLVSGNITEVTNAEPSLDEVVLN